MNPATVQPLNLVMPISDSKPLQRLPVVRKAVPSRKPVGQGPSLPASPVPETQTVNKPRPEAKISPGLTGTSPTVAQVTLTTSTAAQLSGHSVTYSLAQPTSEELPAGWTSAYDPDGRIFYMNHITKTSSWDRPQSKPTPLLSGWAERTTPDGKVYYFHFASQLTTWERPSAPEPILIPQMSPKSPQPIILERQLSSASTDSTFEQQPISPLSPGIEWETSDYNSVRSSRRRSNFSLSSLGSGTSKTMSKIKLPSSASSNVMVKGTVKGTKSAAKLGIKGAKITGKAIKDNRKVIGLTLKVANLVLKNTTGIDMGGLEGLMEGGGDVGEVEIDEGCEDVQDDGGEVEEEGGGEENDEVVVDFSTVDCEGIDEVYVDGTTIDDTGAQDMQSSEVVAETSESTIIIEETTTEQITTVEETTVQETIISEQLTVEQQAAYSGAFSGESLWTEDAIVQETTVQETTIEQITVQETTFVETETSCTISEETSTTVVTTEVDTIEYTTISETTETQEMVVNPPPPDMPPTVEPFSPMTQDPAPPVPMEPFVFAPILAGPMMVEPPAESNGVIFAPTYV
ncbi:hypothetical protein BKA64DRAFT_685576 [Cadophora sp. MPI-SDFR-AT-0126]|nr:hypothetical protein BKA64DRAFT_685576 [Leotiomycetes sp. MPI-SDFR-AT-0126]